MSDPKFAPLNGSTLKDGQLIFINFAGENPGRYEALLHEAQAKMPAQYNAIQGAQTFVGEYVDGHLAHRTVFGGTVQDTEWLVGIGRQLAPHAEAWGVKYLREKPGHVTRRFGGYFDTLAEPAPRPLGKSTGFLGTLEPPPAKFVPKARKVAKFPTVAVVRRARTRSQTSRRRTSLQSPASMKSQGTLGNA
ncbi:MAG: hypothetical protein EXR93_00005 [Gemmatimonadetes bacterium]|nr:hypothetical protein [Gemmatimonadota bacterium]